VSLFGILPLLASALFAVVAFLVSGLFVETRSEAITFSAWGAFIGLTTVLLLNGLARVLAWWRPVVPGCRCGADPRQGLKCSEIRENGYVFNCTCGRRYRLSRLGRRYGVFAELSQSDHPTPYLRVGRFGRWKVSARPGPSVLDGWSGAGLPSRSQLD
jgi:hypothetical protein